MARGLPAVAADSTNDLAAKAEVRSCESTADAAKSGDCGDSLHSPSKKLAIALSISWLSNKCGSENGSPPSGVTGLLKAGLIVGCCPAPPQTPCSSSMGVTAPPVACPCPLE